MQLFPGLSAGGTIGRSIAALLALGAVASVTASVQDTASVHESASAGSVTFTKDIAPILFARCATCHHPEGPAPFSLLTYADARQRASLIAAVTKRRVMPPWKAEPGYGEFIGQRHLSDEEIGRIERWASSGAPEGNPRDLPATPTWTAGWQLGTPDQIVSLEKPYVVRADGPDFSRTFLVPVPLTVLRYVKGLEFRPGNSVVHHANIRITALRVPGSTMNGIAMNATRAPGTPVTAATYPDGYFLGWTPGQIAPLLPKGLSWPLSPGTNFVVEIHFAPTGKAETVKPSIGLYFADDPPVRTPAMLRLGRQNIDIPPGQSGYVTTDSFVLPVDVEVQAVQPHAHYLAREVIGTATLPDGTMKPLIYIKDWDFKWQHVYRYVAPLSLPKGTTLAMRLTFDNSSGNPRNPHQPPVRVHWGQQTTDEMGDIWVQMLTRTDHDLAVLNDAIRPKHLAEDVVGNETMVRSDPANVTLHNHLALMYDQLGRFQEAAAHFEAVTKLQPNSARAHYNLGTAFSAAAKVPEAIEQYRESLRIDPNYALAHNNLGHAYVAAGNAGEALKQFQEAVRLDPKLAAAHFDIATLSLAQGRTSDAIAGFRETVRLQPDWVEAVSTLAWTLATASTPQLRDADQASQLAEHAAALTGRRDPAVLDILAAAQAAAGRFDAAVTTCDVALALHPEPATAAAIRERQVLYRQHQPYVSR